MKKIDILTLQSKKEDFYDYCWLLLKQPKVNT